MVLETHSGKQATIARFPKARPPPRGGVPPIQRFAAATSFPDPGRKQHGSQWGFL